MTPPTRMNPTAPGGPSILVRPAADADLAAIASIYSHHVLHGTATFELDPPDLSEMAQRRSQLQARGLPYLVAEIDGALAGYAYAGPYRPRPAYRFTLENSVYVAPDRMGQGIGSALLGPLIEACSACGCRQLVAVIGDSANTASIRLHARFGFRHVGTLAGVGFKFGRWLDTVLMQRAISAASSG